MASINPPSPRGQYNAQQYAAAHPAIQPQHVPGVRQTLRQAGFNVRKAGPLTPRLLSAWKVYRAASSPVGPTGVSHRWNLNNPLAAYQPSSGPGRDTRVPPEIISPGKGTPGAAGRALVRATNAPVHKLPHKLPKPTDPRMTTPTSKVNPPPGNRHNGEGGGSGGGFSLPSIQGAAANKLAASSMADKLAGMQFDPQIQQLQRQINEAPVQGAQNLADIGNWENQVQGHLATAGTRDAAATQQGQDSIRSAVEGIVNSLGGSANPGAALVGATGARALGTLAGIGQSQSQFDSDLAPILQAGATAARTNEQNRQGNALADLKSQLLGVQGQRGDAKAKASLDILSANNQARQQNFGNRLAQQNAAIAAASLGLKGQQLAAALGQQRIQNKLTRAEIAAKTKATKAPGFLDLNPLDQQTAVDKAVQAATGELPSGIWDPTHVRNSALALLRGSYPSARKSGFKGKGVDRRAQTAILAHLNNAIARAGRQFKH